MRNAETYEGCSLRQKSMEQLAFYSFVYSLPRLLPHAMFRGYSGGDCRNCKSHEELLPWWQSSYHRYLLRFTCESLQFNCNTPFPLTHDFFHVT